MKIVILNGGSGSSNLIKKITSTDAKLTSIVNLYDDGHSTGKLRKFFDLLGPSDVRKTHLNMLDKNNKNYSKIRKLYFYRFSNNIETNQGINKIKKYINIKNGFFLNKNADLKIKNLFDYFLIQLKKRKIKWF